MRNFWGLPQVVARLPHDHSKIQPRLNKLRHWFAALVRWDITKDIATQNESKIPIGNLAEISARMSKVVSPDTPLIVKRHREEISDHMWNRQTVEYGPSWIPKRQPENVHMTAA